MDRRDFMKMAALSGMAVVTPFSPEAEAAEGDELYMDGNFFIALVAGGGWDPTNLCDPKGTDINRGYNANEILQAGNISYAPLNENQAFFEKYGSELLVVNGIDTITNGHRAAERYVWTGHLQSKVHPTFAAFFAAKKAEGRELPLGYLSYGGYSGTGELLPVSRLRGVAALDRLTEPEFSLGRTDRPYRSEFARAKVAEALAARRQSRLEAQKLPKIKSEMSTMYSAQLSAAKLKEIRQYLPETIPSGTINRQIAVTLAACKAGICVSANIQIGGFDTHGDHENRQNAKLLEYTRAVDFMMETAETLGIRERIVLMMSSEFSRTPQYNDTNGKDHWPVASAMFMGPGIRGDRVIGATTIEQRAMGFDVATGLPIEDPEFRLRPHHLHRSLRKLTGIADSEEASTFTLADEVEIDFFS